MLYAVVWLLISACMAESGTKAGGGKYASNNPLNHDLNNALDATANPEADGREGEANKILGAIEDEIAKYTGNTQTSSADTASSGPGSQSSSITKTLEAGTKMVDVVWVMENYHKYKANISKTQKATQTLVSQLAGDTIDLKVAVVSCVGDGDEYSECIKQSETSQWTGVTIIKRPWKKNTDHNKLPLIARELLANSSSQLNAFLNQRTDAKKVFVFVTNTMANPYLDKGGEQKDGTKYEGLIPFLDQKFHKENVSVLSFSTARPTTPQIDTTGFSGNPADAKKKLQRAFNSLDSYLTGITGQHIRIGTKLKSSCASYYSQVYEVMSAYYGGETYDVCQSDWSASTQKIASHIKAIAHPTVALEELKDKLNIQISSVTVDGEKLSASDYRVIGTRPPSIAILKSFQGSPDVVTQTTHD